MKLKKTIKSWGTLLVISMSTFISCDFLDVVPPEQASLPDATQDARSTLGFLYSCYAGVKDNEQPTNYGSPTSGASTDEYVLPPLWGTGAQTVSWNQHSSLSDWKWGSIYRFIGQCHLFLQQLPNAKEVTESQKREWKAEANFLIAYYHFCILRAYGPAPICSEYIPMNTPPKDYNGRFHYDYVTNWICEKLDSAAKDLPAIRKDDEWGRATSTIAKAIKARCLLYAASPLWNGSFPYTNWKNKTFETPGYGTELVSQTYDRTKWEKALKANEEALTLAIGEGGRELYEDTTFYEKKDIPLPFVPGVSARDNATFLKRVLMLRFMVTTRENDGNREMIWGVVHNGNGENVIDGSLPKRIIQKNDKTWQNGYSGISPTLFTVEHFYTANGKLPSNDPTFSNESEWFESAGVANREDITKLMTNREPRFYAWIGFSGGDYGSIISGGNPLKLEMRNPEKQGYNPGLFNRDHSVTGFLNQKYIQPTLNYAANGAVNGRISYPQILMRLAELYLNIAECHAALGNQQGVIDNLNKIRSRAGVPELTAADINGEMSLMDWVKNERFIELWNEGHRFFDVRRWAEGQKYLAAGKREGLNAATQNPDFNTFFKRVQISQAFEWSNRMYLYPLFKNEVYKNPQMVQAPGY